MLPLRGVGAAPAAAAAVVVSVTVVVTAIETEGDPDRKGHEQGVHRFAFSYVADNLLEELEMMDAGNSTFSVEVVTHALQGAAVASVEVVESFHASSAEVTRLRVRFSDGRATLTVIGKHATGAGLAAARRELQFFEHLAPLWDHPAPRLLGTCEDGRGDAARLLLLFEDLGAAGYALPRDGISQAQLHGITDTLVRLHARFWEDLQAGILDPAHPRASVTQSAQAWPPEIVAAHAVMARSAASRFLEAHSSELTPEERALLVGVPEPWERQFLIRTADGRAITLIHGDFHLLGNIFFGTDASVPRVIDWSELKPGLGPHDLAYCLHAAPTEDRPARDQALLRRYWEGLQASGVPAYSWDLCSWDYRFSVITNLFQSVLQDSVTWFRRTAAVIAEIDCLAELRSPPPMS